tara:strand:+ start:1421 stop:2086 length:666 start_codon:yes stop_codon:yes gene_type:complete
MSELLKLAKNGDKKALNNLVTQHLHITKKVASRYAGLGIDNRDLEQEGVFGIYAAINSFDDTKGCSFETYATRRVFTIVDEYVLKNMQIQVIPLYELKQMRAKQNRIDAMKVLRPSDEKIDETQFSLKNSSIVNEADENNRNYAITDNALCEDKIESSDFSVYLLQTKEAIARLGKSGSLIHEAVINEKPVSRIASDHGISSYKVNLAIKSGMSSLKSELS